MPKTIRLSASFLCLLLTIGCFTGCKIKKSKKKDSSFTANFSTKFNVIYNSELILQEGIKNTETSVVDNFQQHLSVFKEPNPASIQQNMQLMDSIIGKANFIINEKKESKYVDKAFLLKGKAYYYQGDYYNANEFFNYVQKNEEATPTIRQEAILWQIRSLIQSGNISEATNYLDSIKTNIQEIKRLKGLLYATEAKYYLNQDKKPEAIEALTKAVEFSKSRKNKLRWRYLLGQLLFEKGKNDSAYIHFTKVNKSNESYEMIFHSNIYRIEILNKDNPNIEIRIKLLSKLLRDSKNKNYKGQIYQRIADTYLNDDQHEKAIANYELANQNSLRNPYQQSINNQKLADLYFNQGEYPKAGLYYDSTLVFLPKEDVNYERLRRKQLHLDSLVKQLTIISYQDTLINLSSLTPAEQEFFIDKIIASRDSIMKASVAKLSAKNQKNNFIESNSVIPVTTSIGTFYFNNSAAINQGMMDFKRRWGNRQSGNYWRYSNQISTVASFEPEVALLNEQMINTEEIGFSKREQYLKDIPSTPEALNHAENKIKKAYITLADIYQNDLEDSEAAIKTYETYLNRFPKGENADLICYHLYRLFVDISPDKSATYKERLQNEFPSSKYSLVINDPDYYKKQVDLLDNFNTYYNTAYELFSSRKYNELIESADKTIQDKLFHSLENNIAQLAYLRAISIGRTTGIEEFKLALINIIDEYPKEEIVVPLVKQHLNYIDSNETQFLNKTIALEDYSLDGNNFKKEFALTPWPELTFSKEYNIPILRKDYNIELGQSGLNINEKTQGNTKLGNKTIDVGTATVNRHENSYRDLKLFPDSANYLFVINVMHGSVNLSPSRYGIGQFNRGQYPKLTINHQLKNIDNENQLIFIGNFASYDEIKAYEEKIKPLLKSIMKIPEDIYTSFIITDIIFNTLANADHIDDYNTIYNTQK